MAHNHTQGHHGHEHGTGDYNRAFVIGTVLNIPSLGHTNPEGSSPRACALNVWEPLRVYWFPSVERLVDTHVSELTTQD